MKHVLHFLTLITVLITTSCSAPNTRHFSDFSEVRVFRLNWEDQYAFDGIMNPDGDLNPTRLPEEGTLLTGNQVDRLEAAVTGRHPDHPVAECFYPHHAFVFYDGHGEIVGHIDICFLCSNYSGEPKRYAKNWDLDAIKKLLTDIGVPLHNPNWK